MPQFPFTIAMSANQKGLDLFTAWQYRYAPYDADLKLMIRATGVSVQAQVFSGSETIQQRTPVQGGGTAGVTPAELTTPPIFWRARAGDLLSTSLDEISGLTPTVDAVVTLEPAS
jgi:hypothetical protein